VKSNELSGLTAARAAELIRRKELSTVDLTRACIERTEQLNPRLRAYITILGDRAMEQANTAQEMIARNQRVGPLHGVPLAVKDCFAINGVRCTAGSKVLENNVPDFDSCAVAALRKGGAIILGTLNMHEFAYGVTTANPFYGICRNPWDTERIPGGSSGGSAAAVAASMCLGALGTDAGGSVRLPAALCGVVGFKPTFGRVSTFGVIPLSKTMDHVGPMTTTVEDAALMLQAIAGEDPHDSNCYGPAVPDYHKMLKGSLKGLRIGLPKEYFADAMDGQVRTAVNEAVKQLAQEGAVLEEVSVPHSRFGPAIFVATAMPEISANHIGYIRRRAKDYSDEVRALIRIGLLIPARRHMQAVEARTILVRELREALKEADVLATPTSLVPAPRVGQQSITLEGRTVNTTAALCRMTLPFNLAGLPAITVPCGFTSDGLPIGLQIAGRPFDEATVLRVAWVYEQSAPWRERRPPL
jgi:aspartyl-tRNA(Asn)/glutamyl-tRNA(Gln) amidotransferase subunit A